MNTEQCSKRDDIKEQRKNGSRRMFTKNFIMLCGFSMPTKYSFNVCENEIIGRGGN